MKKFLVIILYLAIISKVFADSPAIALPYEMISANGRYILKSIPYEVYGAFGKSYVIDQKSLDTVYTLDKYLKQPVKIDNTGKHIISINSWPRKAKLKDIDAITFLKNGKKIKSIKLSDLVSDSTKLFYSVSHIIWYKDSKIKNQSLILKTRDEHLHKFNINSGRKTRTISDIETISKEVFPKPCIVYNDTIDYPNDLSFPNLENGQDLYSAFNAKMPYRIFHDLDRESFKTPTKPYYLMILVTIKGKGEVKKIDFEDTSLYEEMYGADKENIISEYINSLTFDTSTIPPEIGAWVFSSWIHIEQ